MNKKRVTAAICFVLFCFITLLCLAQDNKASNKDNGVQGKDPAGIIKTGADKKDAKKETIQPDAAEREEDSKKGDNTNFWFLVIGIVIGGGGIPGLIKLFKHVKDAGKEKEAQILAEQKLKDRQKTLASKTAEQIYCAALREELGTIHVPGSPDWDSKAVKIDSAFVPLHISHTWRSEKRFADPGSLAKCEQEAYLSPEEAMKLAFEHFRLLLIIGDPGSGKTTLLKYYTMNFLDKQYPLFGFSGEVLPIFFPLRELEFSEQGEPLSLPVNLTRWAERHLLTVTEEQFLDFLQNRDTLVLLDGLDEIGSKQKRRKVCTWIKNMSAGLSKARFVVTSRSTGYRKLDGIELDFQHLRADILDFSLQQQEEFLERWFRAVYLAEIKPGNMNEEQWRKQQQKKADAYSQKIIKFLQNEDNKAVRELAAVPMLLQITALIWKERKFLPRTRTELFAAALNYLLAYRDRQREIEPLLPAEDSRRVLAPTALWMQEELQKDEARKEEMQAKMQPILDTLPDQPQALDFCEFLRDRAGLLADYDRDHYIFRHKSFREFLSALQLKEHCRRSGMIETLISHFKEDWWEEPMRFFMNHADDQIFDDFMRRFFESEVSEHLDANQQTLLQNLVREAPQRKIDALRDCLLSGRLNDNQERYTLDCLRTIGTKEALETVMAYAEQEKDDADNSNLGFARDIAAELSNKYAPEAVLVEGVIEKEKEKAEERGVTKIEKGVVEKAAEDVVENEEKKLFKELPVSFRNPFEGNVEYILIPGNTYKYSVTKKKETVPDIYFCKYPVTNKRYRRFISFLQGRESELQKILTPTVFSGKMFEFASSIDGYAKYLGKDQRDWAGKLRSDYDEDKRFNGEEQPVVSIAWYAARAYCFWLSCLEALQSNEIDSDDINSLASVYRLPTEIEWEWAAGGSPDGSVREYPWPEERGEPSPELANYDEKVGATTPVGRYPDGATPQGLMDMAGNVYEWMENKYRDDKTWRALRGGSWYSNVTNLRCASRLNLDPDLRGDGIGFRVVRSRSCP